MKNTKIPSLISILVLTLITAVMWISFSVYSAFTKKPNSVVPNEVISPITPKLDTETIKQIETRLFLDDSQISPIASSPEGQIAQ